MDMSVSNYTCIFFMYLSFWSLIVISSAPFRSPEFLVGGFIPKYSLSVSNTSTCVYSLTGPTILTNSLVFV